MTLTLLFGGISYEHEISIVTAITLKKKLENLHNLNFIFVDKARDLYQISGEKMKSKTFSSGDYKKEKKMNMERGGFSSSSMFGSKKIEAGVVINLVHGGDGEDGKLASMLEFFDIPFIGPRTEASVMSFNKLFTKNYAQNIGVDVLDYELLKEGEDLKMSLPVILKPLRLGSSIGIA
ncbi:MAG: D-alanine--D-alanine ligase, partial [Campylobacterales bacterium]|nr:D-alanine--D-alanine ligase [Campylobacterales bacterium]